MRSRFALTVYSAKYLFGNMSDFDCKVYHIDGGKESKYVRLMNQLQYLQSERFIFAADRKDLDRINYLKLCFLIDLDNFVSV